MNHGAANATSSLNDIQVVRDAVPLDIFGVLITVAVLLGTSALLVHNAQRVAWIRRAGRRALRLILLAALGAVPAFIAWNIWALAALVADAEPSTQTALGRFAAIGLAGFAALAAIGWITERIIDRYKAHRPNPSPQGGEPDA